MWACPLEENKSRFSGAEADISNFEDTEKETIQKYTKEKLIVTFK